MQGVSISSGIETFDTVICGGGSAGCVHANRLSEDPEISVFLMEADGGDRNPFFHWPAGFARMTKGIASWGWSIVPQRNIKGRVPWYIQAKVIGGGSTINAQIFTRGNARGDDARAEDEEIDGEVQTTGEVRLDDEKN